MLKVSVVLLRVVVAASVVVLLFVAFQLWGTGVQEAWSQRELSSRLDEMLAAASVPSPPSSALPVLPPVSSSVPSTPPPPSSALPVLPLVSSSVAIVGEVSSGDVVARIEIPAIGVDKVMVEGVAVKDLRRGPGHYPETPVPGAGGNSGIAGHRTTYGAPFSKIDELVPGDEVVLSGVGGRLVYRVVDPAAAFAGFESDIVRSGAGFVVVDPAALWVLGSFGDDRVTLTACEPKFSARWRIVVAAVLVSPVTPTVDGPMAAAAPPPSFGNPVLTTPSSVPTVPASVSAAPVSGVELGLGGDRSAVPAAAGWLAAAVLVWVGSGWVGRRVSDRLLVRLSWRLVWLVPTLGLLWVAFVFVDRALPSR